ncbi:PAS domain S-box protein [Hymenobacter psychrotolerans]|uniref:Sensory/regulatory protein RpfC n=1 Tax=Hymenobacter psychrotolerans DSM 18569 TaxID=1121959 RepID=A0A1M6XVS4_9BACT|nr:PAS domain S-box protein [Hymenobacter psychrotolerans]SHL09963.1 PAS domain S-box-containing protein [Hymenobacter psychrotolerans DSM 18569]
MEREEENFEALKAENARLQETIARQQAELDLLRTRPLPPLPAALSARPGLEYLAPLVRLLENVFSSVLLTDPQSHILWLNQGFMRLCGCTLDDIAGRLIKDALPHYWPDEPTAAYVEQCRAQSLPYEFEGPNPNQKSPVRWMRVKAQPLLNAQGQALLYISMVEDATEQHVARQALFENEQRFRKLIEKAPGALYEWRENYDGTYYATYASPKFRELFGISPDEVLRIPEYIYPDDREQWRRSVEEANRQRIPWEFEARMLVPGQPLRWWRAYALVSDQDDNGLVYRGIMHETTAAVVAQELVQASNQRWRTAMEGVGNHTWEYNLHTQQLLISQKYRDLLGHVPGTNTQSAVLPYLANIRAEDWQASEQAFQAYANGETDLYSVIYQLTDAQGEAIRILARGLITEHDEHGHPLILTGTYTDITEITKANRAREASALRLASTIASLQGAVLLEDENMKIILANEAFCRMFQLPHPPEQLVGADCRELAQQAYVAFCDEQGFLRRVDSIREQRLTVKEETLTLKDGRVFSRDATPIYVQDEYIGFLWKYEDITERTTEAVALRRREEKYRSILENLRLGLLEINVEKQIVFVNQSYCDISGYRADELLNAPMSIIKPAEGSQHVPQEKWALRAAGVADTYEVPINTKAGDIKWLIVSGAPLYNDEKQYIGSIAAHLDITHQKELEIKLREAKQLAEESAQAKELFLANMSHEIRTPMNAILGMSQLLAKTPLSGQQNEYLHAIATSAGNLLVIINDVLDQSKIEAGKMTIEHIGFDVRQVCRQVEKTLQYKAEDKGLSLQVHVSPTIPPVLLGDPHRITQVLLNLAGNAIKFTEQGTVRISCEALSRTDTELEVEFRIRDTGIGISPEYQASLFQNFSQQDASVSRKFGGTGLGLSISRKLVLLMGGQIRLESELGHGTTSIFSLRLPVGSPAHLPRPELLASPIDLREALRGRRVLLAEDNEYNRLLAKSFLEQAGMQVQEAENGALAVAALQQHAFDVVLMDVQMPVLNGLDATRQLRKQGILTPIIGLTANAIKGDNEKCLAAGMNDYLSKPFLEIQLLTILHEWLPTPTGPTSPLYQLSGLREMAGQDEQFVAFMVSTFLKSGAKTLANLRAGLAHHDLNALKEAAHEIRPSLAHLQVQTLLPLFTQLENWPNDLHRPALAALVEEIERRLGQVLQQMRQDYGAAEGGSSANQ